MHTVRWPFLRRMIGPMTKREAGFLLIGLGVGLMLASVAVVETALWLHHMFIIGIHWSFGSVVLALPFVCIIAGIVLLRRPRSKALPALKDSINN
jgi:hypothetical protein